MSHDESTTNSKPKPLCRKCGYDLTGHRVEEVCPECGANIWPTAAELVAWARLRGKTLGDSAGLAFAAFLFWFLFPPLGLVLNIAAVHAAWLARRLWMPADGESRRRRARFLLAATMVEALVGLAWSWAWLTLVIGV